MLGPWRPGLLKNKFWTIFFHADKVIVLKWVIGLQLSTTSFTVELPKRHVLRRENVSCAKIQMLQTLMQTGPLRKAESFVREWSHASLPSSARGWQRSHVAGQQLVQGKLLLDPHSVGCCYQSVSTCHELMTDSLEVYQNPAAKKLWYRKSLSTRRTIVQMHWIDKQTEEAGESVPNVQSIQSKGSDASWRSSS